MCAMMTNRSLSTRAAALAVSASLVSTPALGASLPAAQPHLAFAAPVGSWSPASDRAADYRRWGGRHHHHDDGIDGGDILAGLLILGGIAAIASAASKSSKNKQEQRSAPPPQQQDNAPAYRAPPARQQDGASQPGQLTPLDEAADACVDAVSYKAQVDHVYDVQPMGDGYRVTGDFTSGERFTCGVIGGEVRDLHYGKGDVSWQREGARYESPPARQDWNGANAAAPQPTGSHAI